MAQVAPIMALGPRRFAFPHPAAAAKIEPISQPLYSYVFFAAAVLPVETRAFGYPIGGLVAGAGGTANAGHIHTNMEAANLLATPKIALILGYRVIVPALNALLTVPIAASTNVLAAAPDSFELNDLKRFVYGTSFRFFVGTKDYYVAPTWSVPGNVGIEGLSALYVQAPAATGPNRLDSIAVHSQGRYEKLYQHKILIPSQQSFFCSIRATGVVPPTLQATRGLWCVLDAIFGREVQ